MTDRITLPRTSLDERLLLNPEACRFYLYLIANADENGVVETRSGDIERRIGLSRQRQRTLLTELEATNKITKQSTNQSTLIRICGIGHCAKRQPRKQPNDQPTAQPLIVNDNSSETLSFVSPAFQEAFDTWIEYKRKEHKEQYKTERSLQAAYKKLVELSGYDPHVAMLVVEQSMANRWKGLFKLKEDEPNRANQNTARLDSGQSRDRIRNLATEIVSRSEALFNLYND